MELWVADVAPDGTLANPSKVGRRGRGVAGGGEVRDVQGSAVCTPLAAFDGVRDAEAGEEL